MSQAAIRRIASSACVSSLAPPRPSLTRRATPACSRHCHHAAGERPRDTGRGRERDRQALQRSHRQKGESLRFERVAIPAGGFDLAALGRACSGKLPACPPWLDAGPAIDRPRSKAMVFALLLLAGCATFNKPVNVPVAVGM